MSTNTDPLPDRRSGQPLAVFIESHRSFLMLLGSFIVFRVLAIPFLAPAGFITLSGAGPDHLYYLHFPALSEAGFYPYLDYWSEHPPIFPWLAVGIYRLSLLVPAWGNSLLVYNSLLRWALLLFDTGSLVLLYAISCRLRPADEAVQTAVHYALSFAPFFVLLNWYDSIPLFFMLLAIWGMVEDRPAVSGLGAALGFLSKLFPVTVVPAAVQVFRKWPQWGILLGVMISIILAGLLPFWLANPEQTTAHINNILSRPAYQTVWALLEGQTQFGLVAPLDLRIDPATAIVPTSNKVNWVVISIIFFGVGGFLWIQPIDWREPKRSVAFVGLTFGLFLLYSRGLSAPWTILMIALTFLILHSWRALVYTWLVCLFVVMEWPVAYYIFLQTSWVASLVIVLRTLLFVALTIEFAASVFDKVSILDRVAHYALPVTGLTILVMGIIVGPAFGESYSRIRLFLDPLAPLLEAARQEEPGTTIVITPNHEILGRIKPLLRDHTNIILVPQVYDRPWQPLDDWIAEDVAGYRVVWVVSDETLTPLESTLHALETALSRTHCVSATGSLKSGEQIVRYEIKRSSLPCPTPDRLPWADLD